VFGIIIARLGVRSQVVATGKNNESGRLRLTGIKPEPGMKTQVSLRE
jgi:hypothetical protein